MTEDAKTEKGVAKEKVLAYLQSFEDDSVCAGKVYDMHKKEYTDITNVTYCDGEYYWDSTVIYYFEYYDLKLEDKFIEKVLNS